MIEKRCVKCGSTKTVNEFGKDARRPDGLFPYCKRCRRKNPEFYDERLENEAKGLHFCTSCKTWYPHEDFYINLTQRGGLHNYCKDCASASAYQYYHSDKERAKDKNKKRYWSNREHELKRHRKWSAEYRKTPEGKFYFQQVAQKRRKRASQVENTLKQEEWLKILKHQDYTCLRCNRKFSETLKPTMDHVRPLSKGGGLTRDNIQALCRPCNSRKGAKEIDYRQTLPDWIKRDGDIYNQLNLFQ